MKIVINWVEGRNISSSKFGENQTEYECIKYWSALSIITCEYWCHVASWSLGGGGGTGKAGGRYFSFCIYCRCVLSNYVLFRERDVEQVPMCNGHRSE